jgi:hypothetical protein
VSDAWEPEEVDPDDAAAAPAPASPPLPVGGSPFASEPRVRRWPVFVVLAAMLLGGLVADRVDRPTDRVVAADPFRQIEAMPIAAPETSLSSSWFCAGGSARPEGVDGVGADGTVLIANPSDRALAGTIRVVPSEGEAKSVPLEVPARSRKAVKYSDVVAAPFAAALVELDGGDVVVEHQISGPQGFSTAPCASSASERWYVAEGSTAREGANPEDRMLLSLYNPFPEDAIVDLSFSHEGGRSVPSEFTGLVVKGGGLRVVNVGDHVRRRAHVAMTAIARSGRIVVDRIQLRNGSRKGMSLALAATSPGTEWFFPEGLVADGISESFHVYNPTSEEAEVSIELTLETGAAEPFDLTVPPRERLTVVANEEERVPKGAGHAATVVSLNGVPVVAERSVLAAAPSQRGVGAADSFGARRTARRWVLAAGAATAAVDEWVVVLNPGPGDATVTLQALAGGQFLVPESLAPVPIPAGRRVAVRATDHFSREDLALLVSSTAPVVVERGVYLVGSTGIALSAGIPLR